MKEKKQKGNEEKKNRHNNIERAVFCFGLLTLIALLSYLIFIASQERSNPPQLLITTAYEPDMQNYSFKIKVKNFGEETAENANIKMSLYQNGKVVASGTANIHFVPVNSEEIAWMVFHQKRKPTDSLVLTSVTYINP